MKATESNIGRCCNVKGLTLFQTSMFLPTVVPQEFRIIGVYKKVFYIIQTIGESDFTWTIKASNCFNIV